MEEHWKPVLGYEGLYEESDLGRVKSLNFHRGKREKILKAKTNNKYHQVHLSKNGKTKYLSLSRCVWEAFNGPIPEGMEINHIDENTANNRLDNLNLLSHSQNINWGNRNTKVAERLGKKVIQYDLQGNYISDYESVTKAGIAINRNFKSISDCATGKQKTAYGFIWRYAV